MQGAVAIHRKERSRPTARSAFHPGDFCFRCLRTRLSGVGSPVEREGGDSNSLGSMDRACTLALDDTLLVQQHRVGHMPNRTSFLWVDRQDLRLDHSRVRAHEGRMLPRARIVHLCSEVEHV